MVALAILVSNLLLVSASWAVPIVSRSSVLQMLPKGILCNIPFPLVEKVLCSRQEAASLTVSTPLGIALGVADGSDAVRFVVRYGTASRWQESTVVTSWELPAGASDASGLPLTCPQPGANDSTFSEDCLAVILYVPSTISIGSEVPTMMWIHGGSFVTGSATDPGLDGSALAAATESIVAVVQYRLGALGFSAPDGPLNLAVMDIITAMSFLQEVLPSFGGSSSKITLAGQSSGANMIRAILAAPSAASMFQSAILQSDPMDYGFLSTSIQSTLQSYFNEQLPCSSTDTGCLSQLSVDTIIGAQQNLTNNANNISPAAGAAEPIRPTLDGSLIVSPLDLTAQFPSQSKSILLSTVLDEAALTIYGMFTNSVDADLYDEVVLETFNQPRTDRILANSLYTVSNNSETQDARPQLQTLGTDQVWRCATWTFARNWEASGGVSYVGLYVLGASYPGNDAVAECTQEGVVCHQDDIEIVFGTVPSPSAAQSALITEMQARYSAFLHTGNPNTNGYANWVPTASGNVSALQLGGSGSYEAGACTPSFWGDYVQYDYQVYDL